MLTVAQKAVCDTCFLRTRQKEALLLINYSCLIIVVAMTAEDRLPAPQLSNASLKSSTTSLTVLMLRARAG